MTTAKLLECLRVMQQDFLTQQRQKIVTNAKHLERLALAIQTSDEAEVSGSRGVRGLLRGFYWNLFSDKKISNRTSLRRCRR